LHCGGARRSPPALLALVACALLFFASCAASSDASGAHTPFDGLLADDAAAGARAALRSGASRAPLVLPLEVTLALVGLDGDGALGARVDAMRLGQLLSTALPSHRPAALDAVAGGARPLAAAYELRYRMLHLRGGAASALAAALKALARRGAAALGKQPRQRRHDRRTRRILAAVQGCKPACAVSCAVARRVGIGLPASPTLLRARVAATNSAASALSAAMAASWASCESSPVSNSSLRPRAASASSRALRGPPDAPSMRARPQQRNRRRRTARRGATERQKAPATPKRRTR
jgi:hypothetical protein